MAITNKQLVNYARGQLGRPYWYSCYGQKSSIIVYNSIAQRYPEKVKKWPKETYMAQLGIKVHDCSGLIKGAIFCQGDPEGIPKYNCKYDYSADGIIGLCTETGPYEDVPNIPGIVLWKPGHVGILVRRKGNTMQWIEAKGHMHGVVEKTDGTPWKKWGKLPPSWVTYEDIPEPTPAPDPEGGYEVKVKTLKRNPDGSAMIDPNVLVFQSMMNSLGIKDDDGRELKEDKHYGKRSEQACKRFQKLRGLKVDGICGPATWDEIANG